MKQVLGYFVGVAFVIAIIFSIHLVYSVKEESRIVKASLASRNLELQQLKDQPPKTVESDKPCEECAKNRQAFDAAAERVKDLNQKLFSVNLMLVTGQKLYNGNLDEIQRLQKENNVLKKENQVARNHLEQRGEYLSNLTGKILDHTESPLYIEKLSHKETETKLEKEKILRRTEQNVHEAIVAQLNAEKDKLQTEMNEARRYFKLLQDRGIVK